MKKITKILLALLSGVLLSPAYFHWGTGFITLVAFIPLLLIEEDHYNSKKKLLSIVPYAIITFVVFNFLTVWWVKNAAFIGVIAALILNSLFMLIPFTLFHFAKKNLGPRLAYIALIVLWVSFEFIYLNVKINFPWVILGNAFANDVKFIQWYELTGALGGSVWILVINILLFKLFLSVRKNASFQANRSAISWALGFLIVPIVFSLVRYYTYEEEHRPYECVVVQPNIDPYQKFHLNPEEQSKVLIETMNQKVGSGTDYIIAPETFINNGVWQHTMHVHPEFLRMYSYLEDYPDAKLIIGAMTYKRYEPGDSLSATAKLINSGKFYYDSYNSAVQLDETREIQIYHKSLLVAGVEYMPAFNKSKFIQKIAVDLGGITRSHGTQAERDVFISPQDGNRVAPVICWESIFGEYVSKYVKDKEANLIFIITNDGWWGDTPGHRQHNSFAHLRAIETRRSIARSANTGISCLIDQKGDEIERLGWWERGAIRAELNANDHLTFYVKHGDYIARISIFLSILLLLYAFVNYLLPKTDK